MSDDVIQFPQKPQPANPNKCEAGMPGTMVTPNGDVLCIGEPSENIAMPSPEFAKLDLDSLFNMRQWVQSALEAKGAKCVGAGIGVGGTMGIADVQIELDGHQYNIEIRPLPAH